MSEFREKFIQKQIENHYPNARIVQYDDPDSDLVFYTAQQLQEIDADWFPLCCYYDEETRQTLYGGRKNVVHTYTEGATGAGKTTRFVMQSIRALSSMKNKPSFVIVDIHGEIIENMYPHLKGNGYDVRILNCDDPQRSDTYNPFFVLAEECSRTKTISNDTLNRIRMISEMIQPVESSKDPIWDQGARAYTNGCILDKFEDLINGDIPMECITIYNIIQNHFWLRDQLTTSEKNGFGSGSLLKLPHYRKKGSTALSVQKMIGVTDNAEKTRASYYGVIENHYDLFGQPALYSLSSSNTISIPDFVNKPTAIIIQAGSTQIGDALISLLMNDIYTYVVKFGREKADELKRLPRNIHCFLDEFANCNIANGPEFVKMLTTSRKFGMFWHMMLQCDAQLDRKFDPYIGKIIRSNCTEIFLSSNDYETQVRFAKSCGQRTIESLASVISQTSPSLETVDMMTADKLNLLEEGYTYVKSSRHPLLKTYIEAFYNCSDFICEQSEGDIYPFNQFDYTQTAYFPGDGSGDLDEKKDEEPLNDRSTPVDIDASTEKEDSEENIPLDIFEEYEIRKELADYLATQKKKKVKKVVSKLTMIPDCLKQAIDCYYKAGEVFVDSFCEMPKKYAFLKFEIIEEFIRQNDFDHKAQWDRKMQKEYDRLCQSNIFPPRIMEQFTNALHEVQIDLTFGNLKEIKKIILKNDTK